MFTKLQTSFFVGPNIQLGGQEEPAKGLEILMGYHHLYDITKGVFFSKHVLGERLPEVSFQRYILNFKMPTKRQNCGLGLYHYLIFRL